MRWPWQRGTAGHPPAQAPAEPVAPAVAPRVPPAGWAFLPPLQRIAGGIDLTSDPKHFTGSLASWGDPSFTGPMAHLVSTAAPAGVIDVDGDGPVPGDGGYASPSVEMTLLPPPAPRVRPSPGRLGVTPVTAQRVESGGGALEGVSPDGGSLLAAAPDAVPVLHDAAPLQSPGSGPGVSVAGLVSPVESPGAAQPRSTDGSTSDGRATYVPLPSTPAVQRTSAAAADPSPVFRQAPHPPRLGIGMPLSFSEPSGSPEPSPPAGSDPLSWATPAIFPATSPRAFPLPVQRTPGAQFSAPPVVVPPAADASLRDTSIGDAGDGDAVDRDTREPDTVAAILPGDGAGTASGSASTSGGPPDPPSLGSAPAPDPGVDEPVPGSDAVTTEATPSPLSEKAPPAVKGSAPVLSAVLSAGTLDAGDGHAGGDRPMSRAIGTPDSMPVVSRSVAAVEPLSEGADAGEGDDLGPVNGPGHGPVPDVVQTFTVDPSAAEPEAASSGTEPLVSAAAAPFPLVLDAAAGRQAMTAGSPAVQRTLANDAPAETALHAGETNPPAMALSPVHGPYARMAADGPRATVKAGAGIFNRNSSSPRSDALGVQRTAKPAAELQTRTIPTSAGPVVSRVVPTPGPGAAPDSWQRLTELPVAAPAPLAQTPAVATRTAAMPKQSPADTAEPDEPRLGLPAASAAFAPTGIAPTVLRLADTGATGAGGGFGFETDLGETDIGARTAPGPAAEAASSAEPDASPGLSTAVGRVIQRTISVERHPPGHSGPASAAEPGFATESAAPPQRLTGPSTPVQSPAGLRPALLQRLSASTVPTPGASGLSPERAGASGSFASRSFTAVQAYPEVQAVSGHGYESDTSRTVLLSLASPPQQQTEGDGAVQRATGSAGTDSPAVTLSSAEMPAPTSGPKESDGAVAVQGSSAVAPPADPAGAVAHGTATPKTAASGVPAGATPEQLEELAKRLAGPLIRRIKAEMLLDRERRGLRTDTN